MHGGASDEASCRLYRLCSIPPRTAFVGLLIATCFVGAAGPAVSQDAMIDSGGLKGNRESGVVRYLGVPYAQPPVGDLRWRDPRPVDAWSGVREATRFAPACPQVGVSMPGEPQSPTDEDCLYLNVWAPDDSSEGQPYPVIVWIPGGADEGLNLDTALRRGGVGAAGRGRRHGRLSFGCSGLPRPSRTDVGERGGRLGKLWSDGSGRGPPMGQGQHRGFWREIPTG